MELIQEVISDLFTFNYCCIDSVNQREPRCVLHQDPTWMMDDLWPTKRLKPIKDGRTQIYSFGRCFYAKGTHM